MYRVIQFVSARGEDYTAGLIRSFQPKVYGKILARIEYLGRYGPAARPPYIKLILKKDRCRAAGRDRTGD